MSTRGTCSLPEPAACPIVKDSRQLDTELGKLAESFAVAADMLVVVEMTVQLHVV